MVLLRESLPLDLLRCPGCGGAFLRDRALACKACGREFPELDGIPWLFPDPERALGEWRARLHALLAGLESQSARYRAALDDDVVRASTRTRLKLLSGACSDHARRLRALLAPLADTDSAAPELYRALGVEVPASQDLTGYYANLYRDWGWGEEENRAAFGLVDAALGPRPLGRTLLLGAGAGRLAYDLHRHRKPPILIAADINPLFMLAARRLYAGEALELYEFPLASRRIEDHAILRRLQAPEPVPDGLSLVFADATRGPFAAESYDTILTPWLIDIIEDEFAVFARRVNGWLAPGGRWINSGSLAFGSADPARRHSLEEVSEILAESGFGDVEVREDEVPYLCSPASRHGRRETLVTFSATRRAQVAAPATASVLPDWLVRTSMPVPLLPAFEARQLELRVLAYVASLVDGRRSIDDVARILVEQRLMTGSEAGPVVTQFLARLHEETRARIRP